MISMYDDPDLIKEFNEFFKFCDELLVFDIKGYRC